MNIDFDQELKAVMALAKGELTDGLKTELQAAVEQSARLIREASLADNPAVAARLFETAKVIPVTAGAALWADHKRLKNKAMDRLFEVAVAVALRGIASV